MCSECHDFGIPFRGNLVVFKISASRCCVMAFCYLAGFVLQGKLVRLFCRQMGLCTGDMRPDMALWLRVVGFSDDGLLEVCSCDIYL